MYVDYIENGVGHGEVGQLLSQVRFDPYMLRPYMYKGRRHVAMRSGRRDDGTWNVKQYRIEDLERRNIYCPVWNATSLTKEAWIRLDAAVIPAARPRLRAWADIYAACPYGGFDGMAKATLEYQAMSDPGEANQDMDALTEGRNDAPTFGLDSMPLPITHSDYYFSSRVLAESRNTGAPLDTTMAETAGRRVGERVEKGAIGVVTGMKYGTVTTGPTAHRGSSKNYGMITFPQRLTSVTLTAPDGTNGEVVVNKVLDCIDALRANNHYGPYMLYHSTDWDKWLDGDYKVTGGNNPSTTLRARIRQIEDIVDVRRLDYLTPAASHAYTMVLIQLTSDVVQGVNGLDMITVQWPTVAGLRQNFKVMCIHVTRFMYDALGQCGLLHATT